MSTLSGDDIFDSFRNYQRQLLKEFSAMSDEFGFRVLDGRKSVKAIQEELRRQVGEFLSERVTRNLRSRNGSEITAQ